MSLSQELDDKENFDEIEDFQFAVDYFVHYVYAENEDVEEEEETVSEWVETRVSSVRHIDAKIQMNEHHALKHEDQECRVQVAISDHSVSQRLLTHIQKDKCRSQHKSKPSHLLVELSQEEGLPFDVWSQFQ